MPTASTPRSGPRSSDGNSRHSRESWRSAPSSTERVGNLPNLDCFTKWWGPDSATQIVTFPLNQGKDIFVFATCGQEEWTEESWTTPGSVAELRELYRDFHPEARALLDACDDVLKSALYVRDPLASWTDGRSVLLGDAAHPMMPFMAQAQAWRSKTPSSCPAA